MISEEMDAMLSPAIHVYWPSSFGDMELNRITWLFSCNDTGLSDGIMNGSPFFNHRMGVFISPDFRSQRRWNDSDEDG